MLRSRNVCPCARARAAQAGVSDTTFDHYVSRQACGLEYPVGTENRFDDIKPTKTKRGGRPEALTACGESF